MKIKNGLFIYQILTFIFFTTNNLKSNENFYEIEFSKNELKNIKKIWEFNTGIFKDTQNKIIQHGNKLIHLDGNKNFYVISLIDGHKICSNSNKPDRLPYRGISLFKNENNEIYAVFFRNNYLTLINIENCLEKKLKKKIKIKSVVAPVLIEKNIAIILPNGGTSPSAYNLLNGDLVWRANIPVKYKSNLKKYNFSKEFNWDVWGGGIIDKKYNQIIFSTANAKPAYVSKGREGPNLFYNSVVSLNIKNGEYNWHFQEIEHDLLNLDLASSPILYDSSKQDYVIQASKSGQLILLDRLTGRPLESYSEKVFKDKNSGANTFTKIKKFPDWLQFSKSNFTFDDVNVLTTEYKQEALNKINSSIISEYTSLKIDKNYIHYGFHGGSEWPGIGVDRYGNVIVPANNIAWVSKLNNPNEFNFKNKIKKILFNLYNLGSGDLNNLKRNLKVVFIDLKAIMNYQKLDIEKYERFESVDGVPLNSPPWGTVTSFDIIKKRVNWQIAHGNYEQLKIPYKGLGSEIFGCPVIVGDDIFFISGTKDKKIRAYDLKVGQQLWEDDLSYIAYGCPIIASFENKVYLIINASGGAKYERFPQGDAVVAYQLK
jgi:quinoprotein glucose dehydrogenase